ncbi:hypothetical protein MNBD_ALPHA03-1309 [hydrothermal vent metagenome]|uniref:Outer membrane protein beta-barrel domain-containing protein n=1 Tax=hydrothermal vent metagenome TaxID=652676 RepID=A0A3B1AWS3_9ZZZZ
MIKYILLILLSSNVCAGEWYVGASLEHTSNFLIKEQGYGMNAVFVDLTYRHKAYYISGGLGAHSESYDCPEVCFGGNELARLKFGFEFKL